MINAQLQDWINTLARDHSILNILRGYCSNRGIPYTNAEDFLQEAHIRLLQKYGSQEGHFDNLEHFRHSLIHTAKNVARDWLRRECRMFSLEAEGMFEIVSEAYVPLEEAEHLDSLLRRLSNEDRELLRLRFEEGLTLEEVAKHRKCSTATCWRQEQTIKQRLFEWLAQEMEQLA